MIKKATKASKKGFTLIEVIVTLVVAAILTALFVNLMGPSLIGSSISAVRVQNHYELIKIVEKIDIDYKKLMDAGDTNVLETLRSRIETEGYYGQYTQVTKFITFDAGTPYIEQADATPGSNTLKVTISKGGTITVLFTK